LRKLPLREKGGRTTGMQSLKGRRGLFISCGLWVGEKGTWRNCPMPESRKRKGVVGRFEERKEGS